VLVEKRQAWIVSDKVDVAAAKSKNDGARGEFVMNSRLFRGLYKRDVSHATSE
jgi:hypothetical protein